MLLLGSSIIMIQKFGNENGNMANGQSRLSVDYMINYKPNDLYTQSPLGEKEARLLVFVDSIQFSLDYRLLGLDQYPAASEVSVQSKMIATANETNKYIDPDYVIWEKDDSIAPAELITAVGNTGIQRKYTVDITKYLQFSNDVALQSELSTINELQLIFRVRSTVQGPIGPVDDTATVLYTIPLLDKLMVIKGSPNAVNAVQIPTKLVAKGIELLPYAFVCFLIAIGCVCLLVRPLLLAYRQESKISYKRTVDKIFQQHGERLVRLENPLSYQQLVTIPIDGIGEMVKIADEISQPIFYYRVDTTNERKVEFYVFDSGRIYYMVMFGDMGGQPGEDSLHQNT